jgi:predicted SnoaL-like aldol condensation-catalyzing enzyme
VKIAFYDNFDLLVRDGRSGILQYFEDMSKLPRHYSFKVAKILSQLEIYTSISFA